MSSSRGDLEGVARFQPRVLLRRLYLEPALEHEEELASALVIMRHLAAAGRDALLDHAEIGPGQQPPALAYLAPDVVIGVADVLHAHPVRPAFRSSSRRAASIWRPRSAAM